MSDWDGILSTDDSNDSTWNVDSAYVVHVDMHRWTRYISICYFFITDGACKKEWKMVRCPQKDMISDYRRRHCGTVAVENSIMVSAKAIPMVDSKGGSGRFRSRCVTLASDTSLSRIDRRRVSVRLSGSAVT